MRKSQDLDLRGTSIDFFIMKAVELSHWIGEGGWCHPISVNVCLTGIIYFAVKNKAPISASDAKDSTYFIHFAMVKIGAFQRRMG